MMSILEFYDLKYTYDGKQNVLREISGKMEQGKLYAILGPSGCGKTTLLALLGGLDSPAAVSYTHLLPAVCGNSSAGKSSPCRR